MKRVSCIAFATLFAAGPVAAGDRVNFEKHDRNGDGQLSQSEWNDVRGVEASFDEINRNGDEKVTKDELRRADVELNDSGDMKRSGQSGGSQASADSKQSFDKADSNKDQRVSQDEARDAGFDSVVIFYEPIDEDSDGYLDANEWELGINNARFQAYDLNQDGVISELEAVEHERVAESFDQWDTNEDGRVTEDEADIGLLDDDDEGVFDRDDW